MRRRRGCPDDQSLFAGGHFFGFAFGSHHLELALFCFVSGDDLLLDATVQPDREASEVVEAYADQGVLVGQLDESGTLTRHPYGELGRGRVQVEFGRAIDAEGEEDS